MAQPAGISARCAHRHSPMAAPSVGAPARRKRCACVPIPGESQESSARSGGTRRGTPPVHGHTAGHTALVARAGAGHGEQGLARPRPPSGGPRGERVLPGTLALCGRDGAGHVRVPPVLEGCGCCSGFSASAGPARRAGRRGAGELPAETGRAGAGRAGGGGASRGPGGGRISGGFRQGPGRSSRVRRRETTTIFSYRHNPRGWREGPQSLVANARNKGKRASTISMAYGFFEACRGNCQGGSALLMLER